MEDLYSNLLLRSDSMYGIAQISHTNLLFQMSTHNKKKVALPELQVAPPAIMYTPKGLIQRRSERIQKKKARTCYNDTEESTSSCTTDGASEGRRRELAYDAYLENLWQKEVDN